MPVDRSNRSTVNRVRAVTRRAHPDHPDGIRRSRSKGGSDINVACACACPSMETHRHGDCWWRRACRALSKVTPVLGATRWTRWCRPRGSPQLEVAAQRCGGSSAATTRCRVQGERERRGEKRRRLRVQYYLRVAEIAPDHTRG